MSFSDLIQLIVSGITIGSVYSLVALGFHIIYRSTGAINFATGEQVVLGGLIGVTCASVFKFPLFITFIATILFSGIIGVVYERLVIRQVLRFSEFAIVISSLAVSIIMANSMAVIWGKEHIVFPPFTAGEPIRLLGAMIERQSFWVVGLAFSTVLLLKIFFDYSLLGKFVKATLNNRTAAKLVGINTVRIVALTFGLAGGICAMAGVAVAPITYAGGSIGTMMSLKGFVAAVVGGLSSSSAVVLGGIFFGILEFLIAGFISSGYRDAIALFLLLVVLVVKPTGLFVLQNRGRG
jgi:branched-chain amino acid transport system permease protein